MTANQKLFPSTTAKVNQNTPSYVNESIQKRIEDHINFYKTKDEQAIKKRINQLEYEWDTERVLETNFAVIALASSLMGLLGKKGWMALSGVASVFMIQHAFQGWCPPLSIIRRLGIRTTAEINQEKMALQKLIEKRGRVSSSL